MQEGEAGQKATKTIKKAHLFSSPLEGPKELTKKTETNVLKSPLLNSCHRKMEI